MFIRNAPHERQSLRDLRALRLLAGFALHTLRVIELLQLRQDAATVKPASLAR